MFPKFENKTNSILEVLTHNFLKNIFIWKICSIDYVNDLLGKLVKIKGQKMDIFQSKALVVNQRGSFPVDVYFKRN